MRKIFVLLILCALGANASDCASIEQDPHKYFLNKASDEELISTSYVCRGSLVDLQFLENLRNLVGTMRAESIDCVGNEAMINAKRFERVLAFAGMDGAEFLKQEREKNFDAIYANSMEILEFYSERKFINFINFKNFKDEIKTAQNTLKSHFAQSMSESDAGEISRAVIAEFAFFAARDRSAGAYNRLELALKNKVNIDEFRLLLSSSEYSDNDLDNALDLALLLGYDTQFLDALIERGANVNAGEESALFYAMGSLENAKFLISKGAQVGFKNQLGQTPIFYAVASKNYELVNFLIYNHASVNVRQIGSAEKQALASFGNADVCAFNDLGATLLMYSAMNGSKEITELLVKSGASEKRTDETGLNALDYAIFGGDMASVNYLQSLGLQASAPALLGEDAIYDADNPTHPSN